MTNTFQLGNSQTRVKVYHIQLHTMDGCSLGQMDGDIARLNDAGHIASDEWKQAANHYRNINIDQWTIFPDGIRALVLVDDDTRMTSNSGYGQLRSQLKPRALSSFIAGFKAAAAKRINLVQGQPGKSVWKRGYNEQHIDDEITLERVRRILASTSNAV